MKLGVDKIIVISIALPHGFAILLHSDTSAPWSHDFDEDNSTQDGSTENISNARHNTIARLYDQESDASSSLPSEVMNCEAMSVASTESGEWIDPRISHPAKTRNLESSSDTNSYVSGNTSSSVVLSTSSKHIDTKEQGIAISSDLAPATTNEEQVAKVDPSHLYVDVASSSSGESYLKAPISAVGSSSKEYTTESTVEVGLGAASQESDSQGSSVNEANARLSSGVENAKIEKVMAMTKCSRAKATNALLSNDNDISKTILYLNSNSRVAESIQSSSSQYHESSVTSRVTPSSQWKVSSTGVTELDSSPGEPISAIGSQSREYIAKKVLKRVEYAVGHNTDQEVCEIIKNNRWVMKEKFKGKNLLKMICKEGKHPQAVQMCLSSQTIDVNETFTPSARKGQDDGTTALIFACEGDSTSPTRIEIVSNLVKHPNLNINQIDANGQTALMVTCVNGRPDYAELILKHPKIELDIGDNVGRTAFMIACSMDNVEIVKQLINHGTMTTASFNMRDHHHQSAFMHACKGSAENGSPNVVKYLVDHPELGIDFNIADSKRRTGARHAHDKYQSRKKHSDTINAGRLNEICEILRNKLGETDYQEQITRELLQKKKKKK